MKKIYLTLVAVLSVIQFSNAQWTTSGNNIYFTAGNVGIGTSTPAQKLHVSGFIVADGSYTSGGYQLSNTSSTYSTFASRDNSNNLMIGDISNNFNDIYFYRGGGAAMTLLHTNGNVGIGTTTPQGRLHIYEATAGGIVIRAGGYGGNGFTMLGDGYSGTQSNLNLGLGYSSGKGVLSYGVNVSGTATDTYLSSQDQFSTSRWAITMGGASSPNWNLLYAPVTTTTAGTAISMSTAMTVNTSGNVGIGTTSPSEKVDIAGGMSFSSATSFITNNAIGTIRKQSDHGLILKGTIGTTNDLAFATVAGQVLFANPTGTNNVVFAPSAGGSVGIGTTGPDRSLVVSGTTGGGAGDNAYHGIIRLDDASALAADNGGGVTFGYTYSGSTQTYGPFIRGYKSTATTGDVGGGLKFGVRGDSGNPFTAMTIDKLGNIGIGTTTPQEALSVNGNIRSKQVKVETINWPDYVFQKEYTLMPLSEVKAYIDKNHHLTEIPSEEQIAKDGLNLGEMNKLLVKKVEELTLYLIEKDKQVADLKESQKAEQSELALLKAQVEQINKRLKSIAP